VLGRGLGPPYGARSGQARPPLFPWERRGGGPTYPWGLQEPSRNLRNHLGPIEGPKEPMEPHREPSCGPGTFKEPRNFPSHKKKVAGNLHGFPAT